MKCTYHAVELLKGEQRFKVHSVYRHTVNIVGKDRILAFHCDTIPSTPLSLALPFPEKEFEYFQQEAQKAGEVNIQMPHRESIFQTCSSIPETGEVSSKSSDRYCWISTGSFRQNAGEIILWEDKLNLDYPQIKSDAKGCMHQENENRIDNILSILLPVLTANYQLGGFSDCAVTSEKRKDDSFITQILREKTAAIFSKKLLGDLPENLLDNEKIPEAQESDFEKIICSLLGLGPGLTPSGDDFLTGMLLAFSLQRNIGLIGEETAEEVEKKREQICKVISENIERTNDISREYLLCAMENRFGELYHELQKEIYHGRVQQDIFYKMIHTGHSSGLDTLNGLAVGLKLIGMMGKDERR